MKPFLFVTDLDHTLVGEDKALKELNHELERHRQEYGTKIVYATGRSLALYKQLTSEKSLLEPDALITSVGTEVYLDSDRQTPDSEWSTKLSVGWNRELIVDIAANFANELTLQQESEQRPFKISYLIEEGAAKEILPQLKLLLENQNLKFNIIYSGSQDLDILPLYADKGLAVKYIREKFGFFADRTVVCGDSGNDIALFSVGEERGIIVGNARSELLEWYNNNQTEYRYLANAFYANGIIEGLQYFKFID
ncbi:MAG: sucrose-phosphate phosphatase [Nostoc sp. DedQUE01]|uniref:sucrose-phosphate phosphatase n=1 Tax=Nostoc sp. CCY 9925 TaxID=3103865 RepID=UPI002AD9A723|nr:sucrose-phosphate phosphatase [Nostoc sp. DedQUE01]MDZ8081364.1 sucrose-phosphate phosphatase [Nostoc sp. DcaGUA01]